MKLSPPSAERQIPPVELPINTSCEFTGETATVLTRPLVMPHALNHADTVGDGPMALHVGVA